MKKNILGTVVCLGAALGLGAIPAAAQLMPDDITFNLPVAATVGNINLPAGQYTIHDIVDHGEDAVLNIYSPNGSVGFAIATAVAPPAKDSTSDVVLHQTEQGNYELQKIVLAGRDFSYEFLTAMR